MMMVQCIRPAVPEVEVEKERGEHPTEQQESNPPTRPRPRLLRTQTTPQRTPHHHTPQTNNANTGQPTPKKTLRDAAQPTKNPPITTKPLTTTSADLRTQHYYKFANLSKLASFF